MTKELNHFNSSGQAHMVDVGDKEKTKRIAKASGRISMLGDTYDLINQGNAKKGDVLGVARIAGIMAAKRTYETIPLCHNISLEGCDLEFVAEEATVSIKAICSVTTSGKTGAEMEALNGVAAALLTIYDMVKAVDRGMEITDIRLLEKSGGKSGVFRRGDQD